MVQCDACNQKALERELRDIRVEGDVAIYEKALGGLGLEDNIKKDTKKSGWKLKKHPLKGWGFLVSVQENLEPSR